MFRVFFRGDLSAGPIKGQALNAAAKEPGPIEGRGRSACRKRAQRTRNTSLVFRVFFRGDLSSEYSRCLHKLGPIKGQSLNAALNAAYRTKEFHGRRKRDVSGSIGLSWTY